MESVDVDYGAKTAKVHVTKSVALADLKTALEGAGYECRNCPN